MEFGMWNFVGAVDHLILKYFCVLVNGLTEGLCDFSEWIALVCPGQTAMRIFLKSMRRQNFNNVRSQKQGQARQKNLYGYACGIKLFWLLRKLFTDML